MSSKGSPILKGADTRFLDPYNPLPAQDVYGIGSYGEGDNAGWNPRGNGTGSNINVGEEMVLIGGYMGFKW